MLSPQEQSRVLESIDGVSQRASQVIRQARSPWQAIGLVEALHRNIDTVVNAASSSSLAPECEPGCSSCCRARVEVSDPEALLIARHVSSLPADQKALVVARLRSNAARLAQPAAAAAGRESCAFLQAGLCSIYALRPSACRKAHSLSVKACEAFAAEIPQSLGVMLQCEALVVGTNKAFRANQLPAASYELSMAVLAAFASGDAAENWYQGVPLLPSAREAAPTPDGAPRSAGS